MNKTVTNHFTRAFGKAMLAAALLMSTGGHHEIIKAQIFFVCQMKRVTVKRKRKPLRGNALAFVLKSFIK